MILQWHSTGKCMKSGFLFNSDSQQHLISDWTLKDQTNRISLSLLACNQILHDALVQLDLQSMCFDQACHCQWDRSRNIWTALFCTGNIFPTNLVHSETQTADHWEGHCGDHVVTDHFWLLARPVLQALQMFLISSDLFSLRPLHFLWTLKFLAKRKKGLAIVASNWSRTCKQTAPCATLRLLGPAQ